MNIVLLTQYFDTLKEMGISARTNTILLPHSPGEVGELVAQLRNAIMAGTKAADLSDG
jgi:hypothetical protein